MEENQLFYKKFGNGNRTLILFHGFGQTHQIFEPWYDALIEDFTIYSFDLYFHGKSKRENSPLTLEMWKKNFSEFLRHHHINDFYIGAFSMGGRFALATAKLFPESVKRLILVAPDGIYRNPWYRLAVHPATNWIFRYLMYHPHQFNKLVQLTKRYSLASPSLIRFAEKELSMIENRVRVYRSWTYFKALLLSKSQFSEIQCTVEFILGKNDPLIPPSKIQPKIHLFPSAKLHLMPLKHHEMINGSKTLMASLISRDNL